MNRSNWQHLYKTARWYRGRAVFLKENPLCVMCQHEGRYTSATVVDHIKAHKGNERLFYDPNNWQPLCKTHHDGAKQRAERIGYDPTIGEDGWPVSNDHPANKA